VNHAGEQDHHESYAGQRLWLRQILVIFLVSVFTYLTRRLQLDDALIYDRYVYNALHGLGLVYNAGEPVNALTSPLYVYLLLFISWLLHSQVQLAATLIFGASFGAACVLAEAQYRYSGIFLSTMAYFYWLIGMETSVFLFLLMLSVVLYVKGRLAFLPSVLILAVLTRMEAGVLVLVVAWNMYRDRKFPKIASLIPGGALILTYLFLNWHLYGHIVSDSSRAKFGQGVSGYWGVWPTAFLRLWHIWPYFAWTPYVLIGIAVLSLKGIDQMRNTPWNKVILPFLSILFLFYWLFNLPAYHWYYAPFLFFMTIYAVLACTRIEARLAVFVVVLVLQALTNVWWLTRSTSGEHEYSRAGKWLSTMTEPDSRVAACEIGELGWVSNRYIIDILGLTTPKNAEYIARRDPNRWLMEDRPDYIVVHKPAWVWERVAVLSPDYKETSFHSDTIAILRRTVPR
jgi:arabinofuranosyltransferase